MSSEFKLVDVSHSIEHGMITYKGLPAPVITDYLSREESHTRYAPGTEFQIGKIEMVANTGTYLDSPFHRYARGKDLAGLDLSSLANLDGIVVRCVDRSDPEITHEFFGGLDVTGKAVLVHTGWDKHWRTEEYSNGNHPYLTEGAATYLAKSGAALVATVRVRHTQSCSAMIFRSSSTCAAWASFPIVVSSSSPCRQKSGSLVRFRLEHLE
jgi:kynurenine formamidase